jgi:hypothetical protein
MLMTEQAEGFAAGPTKNEPSDQIPLMQWEDAYQKNQSELSALLLVYLFFGNDGKITFSEHRRIKSFLKKEANQLSVYMRNQVASFIENGLSEERMIDIVNQNKYSEQIYDAALTSIKSLFNNDGKLFLMADRLKKKLKSEEIM